MISAIVGRLASLFRPNYSVENTDLADINRLREVQEHLAQSIELANLHDDPLRFPLQAISEFAELQLQIQIKTRWILHDATRVADRVGRPNDIIEAQLAKSFQRLAWEQRLRFSMMTAFLFAACVTIVGAIFAWPLIEEHRNILDATALRTAAGSFSAGWTSLMLQNDLPSMVINCAKSPRLPAPNGRHYCSVWMILDGVEAQPPPTLSWNENTAGGQTR